MSRLRKITCAAICIMALGLARTYGFAQAAEEAEMENSSTRTELLKKIDMYRMSIVNAEDLNTAEQVWAATPESSFIHPRGHELGWEQIKRNFYSKTMAGLFSKRQLKLVGEPLIHLYDNAATVEFDWEFTATMRSDGSVRHTGGRESQVFINTPEQGWRLVHVHYSSQPAKPETKDLKE